MARVFALMLIALLLLSGCCIPAPVSLRNAPTKTASGTPTPTVDPAEAAIKITAEDLLAAYDDNEIAADQKYKKQMVLVDGTIDSIGKDFLDRPYITMGGDFLNVHCTFERADQLDKIAALKKGDQVKILGKCNGATMGSPMMDDCSIVN